MDRRVTILESIERKSMAKQKKPVKLNDFGNRIIENWCAYANELAQLERDKNRKVIVVSAITEKDRKIFQEAYRKLVKERAKQQRPLRLTLKRLVSSRSIRNIKSEGKIKKSDEFQCTIDYKRDKPKSAPLKREKSKVKIEIVKPKKAFVKIFPKPELSNEKKKKVEKPLPPPPKPKPVVNYPPIKTRPWFPCAQQIKPKNKPVIEYPPLTMRTTPWRSPQKSMKPRIPRVRLEKTFYPFPASTLGKSWNQFKFIGAKLQILRGHTSQYSKKFNFRSNGKQSAFIAVVALVNAQLCPMKLWASDDLDEIISYGDINFRKQMRNFQRHALIKPPEIKFKVYTSRAKIYTEIGVRTMKGIFDQSKTKDFENHLEQILNEYGKAIFTYCGQSFAIWKELNAFYIFNSDDTNQNGNQVEKHQGACCVLRSSDSINQIANYLAGYLRIPKKCYELYSFKINEKVTLKEDDKKSKVIEPPQVREEAPEEVLKASMSKKDFFKARKTGIDAVLFERQPQPEFGQSFRQSSLLTHGFLKCDDFLKHSPIGLRQAPFICSTAIAMLRLCKSSIWRTSTMREIFRMGRDLFTENVEKVLIEREARRVQLLKDLIKEEPKVEEIRNSIESQKETKPKRKNKRDELKRPESTVKQPDIPITEIHPVLSIKSLQLEIHSENVVFGKIQKRGHDVIALEDGLKIFFKNFDCGLIQGPDVVAIWREQTFYFMFDPNQCDDFQRSDEGENSCLSWFKDIDDLIKLYIENIPREFRNSIFKIAKVETSEHEKKAENWQNFKAVGSSRWILSGTISEASEIFNAENRNHQSTCIAVAALAKTLELGIHSWTSETVDEIVELGDDFYSGSMMTLDNEKKVKDRDFFLSDLGTELKLEKTIVDFVFDECVVVGSLEGNDELLDLSQGLSKFFEDDDQALITTCGISLAVWKREDEFYLFDSHDRDDRGRNLKAIDPIDGCMIPGSACVLRFLSINDLVRHILANVEIGDTSAYNISRVEATARSSEFPCLYNYKKLGHEPYAAILYAFNDVHEDSEQFRSMLPQKTICNLVACLSFAKILNPRQWQCQDINEIMKMGYKLLCNNLVQGDEQEMFNHFEKIEVSSVKMSLKLEGEEQGTFTGRTGILPTATTSFETVEDQVKISELEMKASRPSINFSEGKQSNVSSAFTGYDEKYDSLKTILNNFQDEKEIWMILQSKIFDIAIFKLDRFYFVFDPKAADHSGFLVQQRLEDFLRRTLMKERERLIDALSETKVKRLSLQEELQEFVFGRPVVFIPPLKRPSLPIVSSKLESDLSPIMISETGSAYVAWFSSIELLHNHIMRKIPSRFTNEVFTLRLFTINKIQMSEEIVAPWNNFESVSVDHFILRGSLSQNDTLFPNTNRNNQDIPNAIIALTFSQLCSPTDWASTVIDIILKLGDRLFKKSLSRLLKISSLPSNLRLRLEQLDLPVFLRPYVISINDELIKKESMVKANDAEPLEAMKKSISDFFESSESSGILAAKDYHVAIWRDEEDAFMMFDPHDVGPNGIRKSTGFACLQRFTNLKKLVEVFHRNVKELDGANEYQLTRVSVVKNHFQETNEDGDHRRLDKEVDNLSAYSDYNLFTSVGDVRSIRALEANTIEWTKENIPMGICYAIATLCVSLSLDPEFFTRDIIDKMIIFGNELISQCDGICYNEFDLCKQQLCPDEINWNFELNNVHVNVQMDIFQRGIVSIHPCPAPKLMHAIEEFFNFYSSGVLITQSFVVAIWKESSEFFIFYSSPIDEVGKMFNEEKVKTGEKTQKANFPGIVVFKTINELYESIIGNLDRSSYCKPFELRVCTIETTDFCENEVNSSCECSQGIKKLLNEEFVLPAVEAIVKNDPEEEVEVKCKAELTEEQKEIIRAKRGNSIGFIPFGDGEIICGQLSRESKQFNEYTRTCHAGAICVLSVAMSSLRDLNCWSGNIIDRVIKSGNSLYIESSVANDTKEVTLSMLITSLHLEGAEIVLKVLPFQEIARDEWNHESLLFTLCHLFSCYSSGYLGRGFECWSIFKREKAFYLFDPLGLEVSEKKICRRRAVLYKFKKIELLIEQLFSCVNDSINDEIEETFKIGAIISCPLLPSPEARKSVQRKSKTLKKKKKCGGPVTTFKPLRVIADAAPICEELCKTDNLIVTDESCAY